jgi:hypothetical protein
MLFPLAEDDCVLNLNWLLLVDDAEVKGIHLTVFRMH